MTFTLFSIKINHLKTLTAFVGLAIFGTASLAGPNICATYAADLNVMVQIDQAARERISYDSFPIGEVKESNLPKSFQHMIIVDRVNTLRFKRLIRSCGWPRKSVHGEQAVNHAWLLAQHAEPKAQQEFLPLLENAVKAGEASPSELAFLSDRIAVHRGRPQLYGTQFNQMSPCEFEFYPLDDRSKVNERRKAAGMLPLEEYERTFREHISKRGCGAKVVH
jgi:hypothetical protein